jgi:dihydropteroate synthase
MVKGRSRRLTQSTPDLDPKSIDRCNTIQLEARFEYAEPFMPKTLPPLNAIDRELSNRHIDLDPGGYFIIYIDREAGLIGADRYTNTITEGGLAADPETGEVIACSGGAKRSPADRYQARTAKELCVKIFESDRPCPVTMFDHAAYLGREFMRAEMALVAGEDYIQD